MSAVPFQSHAVHARNIRRAFTERRGQTHTPGVDHMPCLHHAKSSEARLDQMVNEEYLHAKHHHTHMNSHQSKSENNVGQSKSSSNENIITAFARPEAWKIEFGSGEGIKAFSMSSTGNLNKR
jgi:hypothetical protein